MLFGFSYEISDIKVYIWEVIFWVPEKGAVFSVLYREASRRFRRIPEGSGIPKWFHNDPRASMGCGEVPWPYCARRTKSSKAHVAREGEKGRSPSRNRIGLGVQVLSPLAAP